MRAPINRILRSSIVDGPGNRAVIFVQGCNYNCLYCHNPETIRLCSRCGLCVESCPSGALTGGQDTVRWTPELCVMCDECIKACPHDSCPRVRELSAAEIMTELALALPFIRGITVSGGECTLYPEFLCELFEYAREKRLTCFLDTNGSFDFEKSPRLLACTDGIMLDVKAADGCERVTGVYDGDVLKRAVFLAKTGKLWEVRTVIVPNIMDAHETVRAVCAAISPVSTQTRYKLIRYRPNGVSPRYAACLEAPDDELMGELSRIVEGFSMTPVVI